jgi:hypothetical protein
MVLWESGKEQYIGSPSHASLGNAAPTDYSSHILQPKLGLRAVQHTARGTGLLRPLPKAARNMVCNLRRLGGPPMGSAQVHANVAHIMTAAGYQKFTAFCHTVCEDEPRVAFSHINQTDCGQTEPECHDEQIFQDSASPDTAQ